MTTAADTALEVLARSERPLRFSIEALAVISLAYLVARLVWLVLAPSAAVATYTDRPLPSPLQGAQGGIALSADRTILVRSNPFDQGETDLEIPDAPETSLNLQLDGLRMSTMSGEAGNAIIRTPDGRGQNFAVGDEILAGVTLQRILSNRVIINRDGASETLMLGGRGAGLSVISDDSRGPTLESRLASDETPDRRQESEIIEGRLAGPELFFGNINATLVRHGGAASGYRLDPIGDAAILRQAGLEPGDMLLQINGAPAAGLDINEMLDQMRSAETLELRVNRNGSDRTIRLRFGE